MLGSRLAFLFTKVRMLLKRSDPRSATAAEFAILLEDRDPEEREARSLLTLRATTVLVRAYCYAPIDALELIQACVLAKWTRGAGRSSLADFWNWLHHDDAKDLALAARFQATIAQTDNPITYLDWRIAESERITAR